jgi:hypothetical protein
MLGKMLLVVLVLVGQLPFRICTCGAAHHDHGRPPPLTAEHLLYLLGLGGHHPVSGYAPDTPDGSPATAPTGDHHDPDCQAVNPRPVLKSAPLAAVETAESDAGPAGSVLPLSLLFPNPVPAAPVAHPPTGPPVPLYISFQALRN